MNIKEKSRREIEERSSKMGDYLKINYLRNCLKQSLDFDTKRFVLVKLGELYEGKKMFLEAGKMMMNVAPINTTFQAKTNDFLKSAELFIKAGNFDEADIAFEKALGCCNDREKEIVKAKRMEYYRNQAKIYFDNDKRQSAVLAFEKLLALSPPENERKEVQEKLLGLYERLGKIRDFYNLKRVM